VNELKVGDTLKAGTFVLFSSGSYSDYGIGGLYRVKDDVVIPGKSMRYGKPGEMEPDQELLSTNPALDVIEYVELWRDN
jgi:hypothetical protein